MSDVALHVLLSKLMFPVYVSHIFFVAYSLKRLANDYELIIHVITNGSGRVSARVLVEQQVAWCGRG